VELDEFNSQLACEVINSPQSCSIQTTVPAVVAGSKRRAFDSTLHDHRTCRCSARGRGLGWDRTVPCRRRPCLSSTRDSTPVWGPCCRVGLAAWDKCRRSSRENHAHGPPEMTDARSAYYLRLHMVARGYVQKNTVLPSQHLTSLPPTSVLRTHILLHALSPIWTQGPSAWASKFIQSTLGMSSQTKSKATFFLFEL
jgi:hypothetical protein